MTRKFLLVVLLSWIQPPAIIADEGLWLPMLLKQHQEGHLRRMGLNLPVEELYSDTASSLKDAVVLFGGGCTGEVVSDQGLILTNHHCGYSSIQSHSTVDNDYLTRGYWALTPADELPCPGLSVTFIIGMHDVTEAVLHAVADTLNSEDRERYIRDAGRKLAEEAVAGSLYEAEVRAFYNGNRYYLIVTEIFKDIRLVGAPPSSVGNFGGDTDNWMWPRHTGDFSVFRIYAGADNKPADYSPDNKPYRPRRHFTISLKGIREGDFTMVYGFPGVTREYLSSFAVEMVKDELDPARIAIRDERLRIMGEGMKRSDTVRLQYASKQKSISNAYKKWQGEARGLTRLGTVGKKQAFEVRYQAAMAAAGRPDLAGVVDALGNAYGEALPFFMAQTYYREAAAAVELLEFARSFRRLAGMDGNTTDRAALDGELTDRRASAAGFFKNYDPRIDKKVFAALLRLYYEKLDPRFIPDGLRDGMERSRGDFSDYADRVFRQSVFADEAKLADLLDHYSPAVPSRLSRDPAYRLAEDLAAVYNDSILIPLKRLAGKLDSLDRQYMAGQLLMAGDSLLYPDANSTLRIAYGKVMGYTPRDAVRYRYYTTLEGVMEKEDPADEEFIVDNSLKNLFRQKDYGRYGTDRTMPVAFLATNHTTGGNSGSPVLNGEGQLIGINFDRVWEGTMSDYDFDPDVCRNISVDIRYVLFVMDKVAGASRLISELTFAP